MEFKEKIIQYWLTFVLTFLGFSKSLIIIPFVLQFSIRNKFLADFTDFIFKPADYISGLFVVFAAFSGPMIFLTMILAGIAKFLLFAAEAYILAGLIIFLAKSESVKNFTENAFNAFYDKLEIRNKIEKYPILKNVKYFIPVAAIIILIIAAYPLLKKNNIGSGNTAATAVKETITEQAKKIEHGIDSDSDGLLDNIEFALGTNPYFADSDNDGHTDFNELKNGYSPFISSDGRLSADNYELVKKEVFISENIQFGELEKLRLGFIGQISNQLCAKSPNVNEVISEDNKKAADSAIIARDSCLCSKVTDDKYRNICFNRLANTTINMSLCNYIVEESSAQNYRDDCLHTSMLITLDWKYCERIRGAKKQGECFMILSLKTKNYTYCDKVKDMGAKDSCYYDTAIFSKKIDLCDKISPDNKGGDSREACKSMTSSRFIPKVNF